MRRLSITDRTISELKSFREESKFAETFFYPGATSEELRHQLENEVNSLIDMFIRELKDNPSKSYVLTKLRDQLKNCEDFDTENQEMVCEYLDRLLDILGIESSDGLLNEWLYGFDPGNV